MRELEKDTKYEGKVRFTVKAVQENSDEVKAFDIGSHGLVGLTSDGKLATKIPGHNFGKGEIIQAIDTLLAG